MGYKKFLGMSYKKFLRPGSSEWVMRNSWEKLSTFSPDFPVKDSWEFPWIPRKDSWEFPRIFRKIVTWVRDLKLFVKHFFILKFDAELYEKMFCLLVQVIKAKCGGCHTMVHGVPGYTQSEEEVGEQMINILLF